MRCRTDFLSLGKLAAASLLIATACGTPSPPDTGDDVATGGDAADVSPVDDAVGCDTNHPCPVATAPCTTNECAAGECVASVTADAPCDDDNVCTTADKCGQAGACVGIDSGTCECQADADCSDDGDLCNGVPICDLSNHTCTVPASSVVKCPPTAQDACRTDACDPTSGECVVVDVADKLPCDDNNPCTGSDRCKSGACEGVGSCECQNTTDCPNDADLCNGALYCDKDTLPFVCRLNPATVVDCPDLNDDPCIGSACNPALGECEPSNTASACDVDGSKCTVDACKDGTCVAGSSTCACAKNADCDSQDDGDVCNGTLYCNTFKGSCEINPASVISCPTVSTSACLQSVCAPSTGACKLTQTADNSPCHDGTPCTKDAKCKGGECKTTVVECGCQTAADCAGVQASLQDKCLGHFYCDKANGNCKINPSSQPVCNGVNDSACLKNQCQPKTGDCAMKPIEKTIACEDGSPCTSVDTCAGGSCGGGENGCSCKEDSDCADINAVNKCVAEHFCNKATSRCVPKPNSGVVCTAGSGTCSPDACDPKDGKCKPEPKPDGTVCGASTVACVAARCASGSCEKAEKPVGCSCWLHSDCAAFEDGNACNGTLYCAISAGAGECAINPASIPQCTDDAGQCKSAFCDPTTGACAAKAVKNGAVCDDANVCTKEEACAAGECVAAPGSVTLDCDDGNGCTVDLCAAVTGCVSTAASGGCDDGSACTAAEACEDGACAGATPVDCDDANPCTADGCDPKTGCVSVAQEVPCSDGDSCTNGDFCANGQCKPGPALTCNDLNTCTKDSCSAAKGCVFAAISGGSCDDGDACTQAETCTGGECSGPAKACTDQNACTLDGCDPTKGCTFAPRHLENCDDGSACTINDHCVQAKCVGDTGPKCDDKNGCTTDSCDPLKGCVFANKKKGAECDNGDLCTELDECDAGACKAGFDTICEDENDCTTDTCNKDTGCKNAAHTKGCDDNDACTNPDVCSKGACQSGKSINCDDINPCTKDSCTSLSGCQHTAINGQCDDGSACTQLDTCVKGKCVGGSGLNCDDGNDCTKDGCDLQSGCKQNPLTGSACTDANKCTSSDVCDKGKCTSTTPTDCDDKNLCTTDTCTPNGGCSNTENSNTCDDGDACTATDICQLGQCEGMATVCADGNSCTDDSCDAKLGCVFSDNTNLCDDGNPCTTGDACAQSVCAATPKDCNDNNPCTSDTCAAGTGACSFSPVASPCSDGDDCTVNDACTAGSCVSGLSKDCVDNDACTADACTAGSCTHNPVNSTFSLQCDGDTFENRCYKIFTDTLFWDDAEGACVVWNGHLASISSHHEGSFVRGIAFNKRPQQPAVWIGLGDTGTGKLRWTDETPVAYTNWNPQGGWPKTVKGTGVDLWWGTNVWQNPTQKQKLPYICERPVPGTTSCDDGNACSVNDTCKGAVCATSITRSCDDQNACTTDSCDGQKGCVHNDTSGTCDDGDKCTEKDVCNAGVCKGETLECHDNKECTGDSCNSLTGCEHKNHPNGRLCTTGACKNGTCGTGLVTRTIAVESTRSYVLRHDGHVYAWGAHTGDMLGTSVPAGPSPKSPFKTTLPVSGAVATTYNLLCIITKDGVPMCTGLGSKDAFALEPPKNGEDVVDIAGNRTSSFPEIFMVTASRKILKVNRLDNTATDIALNAQAVRVAVGLSHACAITFDGQTEEVRCWGSNDAGQLGTSASGTVEPKSTQAVAGQWLGLSSICAGEQFTCLTTFDSTACWGEGSLGQLGNGKAVDSTSPVAVNLQGAAHQVTCGQRHACALQNGQVYCWGDNSEGQLGDGSVVPQKSPVLVRTPGDGLTDIQAIEASGSRTCARNGSGHVYCWGANSSSEDLFNKYKSNTEGANYWATELPTDKNTAITSGDENGCALRDGGQLWCWGQNHRVSGGLPIPTFVVSESKAVALPVPTRRSSVSQLKDVTLSKRHGCYIDSANKVYCWGYNDFKQLGGSAPHASFQPTPQYTGLVGAHQVEANRRNTCARFDNGIVRCWGSNEYGQNGIGSTGGYGTAPVKVFDAVTDLTVGYDNACALSDKGAVKCWGRNVGGDLGTGDLLDRSSPTAVKTSVLFKDIDAGTFHTCGIASVGGAVYCWGKNSLTNTDQNLLGDRKATASSVPVKVVDLTGANAISVSGNHSCAIFGAQEQVSCWGYDSFKSGHLGVGPATTAASKQPVIVLTAAGSKLGSVKAISTGSLHTCMLFGTGKMRCVGKAQRGQLGTGHAFYPYAHKVTELN